MVVVLIVLAVVAVTLLGLYLRGDRASAPSGVSVPRQGDAPVVEAWAESDAPGVRVANRSGSPVHDVQAFVAVGRRRPKCVGWIRTLPPTGDEAVKVAITADSRESWMGWQIAAQRAGQDVAVEVRFRDQAGRKWRRDRSGTLAAIDG